MTFRQRLGLGAAPLIMRVVLGVVFLWAGSSKLFVTDTFSPERSAALANIGVVTPGAPPAPGSSPETDQTNGQNSDDQPDEPLERDAPADDETEQQPPAGETNKEPADEPRDERSAKAASSGAIILARNGTGGANGAPRHTAGDFPEGVEARRLYSLSLLLHARANPAEGGTALWPGALASDTALMVMPWVAAVTEFLGGVLLVVGLLTRPAALGHFLTMAVALVLTSIGPAAVSGDAFLGFLPDPAFQDPDAWVSAWQTMLFQLTTGALALALVLTGGGWLSLDRAVFGKRPAPKTEASP